MFEVVNVQDNSVRIRAGLVVIDTKVLTENGKQIVRLPNGVYVNNFKTLVGIVLDAYEIAKNGDITTNDKKIL